MAAPVVSIFEVGDYDGQIAQATQLLRGGGVVVLPTETVYGAAAVLGNDKAIARLKAIRGKFAAYCAIQTDDTIVCWGEQSTTHLNVPPGVKAFIP